MFYYVYILECIIENKRFLYIGYSKNLSLRIKRHLNGEIKTTKKFDKIKLIYYEACINKKDAIKREAQLKTGFGRGYINRRLKSYFNKRV